MKIACSWPSSTSIPYFATPAAIAPASGAKMSGVRTATRRFGLVLEPFDRFGMSALL